MEKLKDVINLLNQGKVREEAEKTFVRFVREDFQNFSVLFFILLLFLLK